MNKPASLCYGRQSDIRTCRAPWRPSGQAPRRLIWRGQGH